MLSAPVFFGLLPVRLDAEANYFLDHLPALRVSRRAPQMLNLIEEVFVDEGAEL